MSISHFTSKLGEFYRIEEYNIFSDLDMYINGNDEEKNYLELLDKIKKDFFDFKNNNVDAITKNSLAISKFKLSCSFKYSIY